jgi:cobyrinic acid a,c-diamide synthase
MILEGLPSAIRPLVMGFIPYDAGTTVKERHLGLTTVEEVDNPAGFKAKILESCRDTLHWEDICQALDLKRERHGWSVGTKRVNGAGTAIGIATDRAFSFYYQENLDRLEKAGATLVPFSPISSREIPRVQGLYFGGGYPEVFARELSENTTMRSSVRAAADEGMPIYGECGGMMYLSSAIQTFDGALFPMVGVFPISFQMDRKFLAIKYVEIETREQTPLGPPGIRLRGQEFHQSRPLGLPMFTSYDVRTSDGKVFVEGLKRNNVLGSYIHLHFRSNPTVPSRFVEACKCFSETRDC